MNLFNTSRNEIFARIEALLSDSKLIIFILTVLGFIVFWPALQGDFVGDDVMRIVEYEPLMSGSLGSLLSYYTTDRPIVMVTIWLNYKMGGLNPFVYKLTNLLFHLLCVVAGLFLLRRLLKNIDYKNTASFFAALLFLVHPLNHHVVQAAVQRSIAMAGLFFILSFICFIDFNETGKRQQYFYSLGLFLLAVLCKPVSVALPLVLGIYLLMKKARLSEIVKWISGYFLFWLIPLWTYNSGNATAGAVGSFKFEHWRYFLIQTKVFFIYLYKFIVPFPLEFIHPIHNSAEKIYSENFVPYVALYFLIILFLLFRFLKTRSLLTALLLMAYTVYLPQSSFYSIIHVLFYHRLYLSVLFGTGALVYLIFGTQKFRKHMAAGVCVMALCGLYFSTVTFTYFTQVKSYSDWLWYNVNANPGNLNFNVSTLFMLKRKGYPEEVIKKFADFFTEHTTEKEVMLAKEIAIYSPESPDAKQVVLKVAAYLNSQETSNSLFHGCMLFLETEAARFFQPEQAVLSLNSMYFSRLNTSVFLNESVLKGFAKRNFESVLNIRTLPKGVDSEKLTFLKLRSQIVLLLFFNENTGLSPDEALALLQNKYKHLPESQWLAEKLLAKRSSNP